MKFTKEDILLYGVTSRNWLGDRTLAEAVQEAVDGGITMLQLREKELGEEEFLREALEIKNICRGAGIPFIINDNVRVAKESDADGIHIGQDDMNIDEVRRILGPDKIIGVSAHNTEEALEAEKNGADYLGAGAVFSTSTKSDAGSLSLNELKNICSAVSIPVTAIGGITRENLDMLSSTGIDGIAVVSDIFAKKNIEESTAELKNKIEALDRAQK